MKFIHLSDLHLGKRVNEFSMIEDQKYILTKIINIIDNEQPDGLLIAGDVYDRSVPSEEAMQLWDDFLGRCVKRNLPVFAISGNHDSAVRFADHSQLIHSAGIHLSPVYDGKITPFTLSDEHGTVEIYMLPFIKPVNVRQYFPDEEIKDYTDACRVALAEAQGASAYLSEENDLAEDHRSSADRKLENDSPEAQGASARRVLIAHQFVTGADRCESEEIMVGGLDNVDASVFDGFDYVALGHIHGPQKIGRETVRYCGTPLKYSFSEKNHKKSVTVVELRAPGDVTVREVPLTPLRDLREIRGTYAELTAKANYEGTALEDYIHVVLTDEEDIPDAIGKLRVIYPNLMKLSYDNKRTRENRIIDGAEDVERKSPLELFEEFYELQNNQPMSDEQKQLTLDLITSIWEEE